MQLHQATAPLLTCSQPSSKGTSAPTPLLTRAGFLQAEGASAASLCTAFRMGGPGDRQWRCRYRQPVSKASSAPRTNSCSKRRQPCSLQLLS